MKRNTLKTAVTLLVCAFTLFALFPLSTVIAEKSASPVRQDIGTNLLVNPGFEGIGKSQNSSVVNPGNWTRETFNGEQRGEIFTPEGWVTWWQGGDFKIPECKVIPNEHPFNSDPTRILPGILQRDVLRVFRQDECWLLPGCEQPAAWRGGRRKFLRPCMVMLQRIIPPCHAATPLRFISVWALTRTAVLIRSPGTSSGVMRLSIMTNMVCGSGAGHSGWIGCGHNLYASLWQMGSET